MVTKLQLPLPAGQPPVPHVFIRQPAETDTLGVLLPGYQYSADMPLLFYPRSMLLSQAGADLLQFDYAYHQIPGFINRPEPERYARLKDDVSGLFEAALAQRAYRKLVLVGKSLGTAAMTLLLSPAAQSGAALRCVWLTPILTSQPLAEAIRAYHPPSLFLIGAADRYYQQEILDDLLHVTAGKAVVIADADHGLEIPGHTARSLDALKQVILAVEDFLHA